MPRFLTAIALVLCPALLDVTAFKTCLDTLKYKQLVADNQKEGATAGVSGNLTFLIGKSTPEGIDGIVVAGAQSLEAFEAKFAQFDVK